MNTNQYRQADSNTRKARGLAARVEADSAVAMAGKTAQIYAKVYRTLDRTEQSEQLALSGAEDSDGTGAGGQSSGRPAYCHTCRTTVGGNSRNHARLGHKLAY